MNNLVVPDQKLSAGRIACFVFKITAVYQNLSACPDGSVLRRFSFPAEISEGIISIDLGRVLDDDVCQIIRAVPGLVFCTGIEEGIGIKPEVGFHILIRVFPECVKRTRVRTECSDGKR